MSERRRRPARRDACPRPARARTVGVRSRRRRRARLDATGLATRPRRRRLAVSTSVLGVVVGAGVRRGGAAAPAGVARRHPADARSPTVSTPTTTPRPRRRRADVHDTTTRRSPRRPRRHRSRRRCPLRQRRRHRDRRIAPTADSTAPTSTPTTPGDHGGDADHGRRPLRRRRPTPSMGGQVNGPLRERHAHTRVVHARPRATRPRCTRTRRPTSRFASRTGHRESRIRVRVQDGQLEPEISEN